MRSDALSALLNLGYQRGAAEKAVGQALNEVGDVSVESILCVRACASWRKGE